MCIDARQRRYAVIQPTTTQPDNGRAYMHVGRQQKPPKKTRPDNTVLNDPSHKKSPHHTTNPTPTPSGALATKSEKPDGTTTNPKCEWNWIPLPRSPRDTRSRRDLAGGKGRLPKHPKEEEELAWEKTTPRLPSDVPVPVSLFLCPSPAHMSQEMRFDGIDRLFD